VQALRDFLQFSTTLDWLVTILIVILVVTGVILLIVARRPRPFYVYLGLGLMPLLLGLLTTYLKNQELQRMVAMLGPDGRVEVAEAARREAWMITYIGAGGTVVAIVIALLGMISKRGRGHNAPG